MVAGHVFPPYASSEILTLDTSLPLTLMPHSPLPSDAASWGQMSSLEALTVPATVVACGFCELFVLPPEQVTERVKAPLGGCL